MRKGASRQEAWSNPSQLYDLQDDDLAFKTKKYTYNEITKPDPRRTPGPALGWPEDPIKPQAYRPDPRKPAGSFKNPPSPDRSKDGFSTSSKGNRMRSKFNQAPSTLSESDSGGSTVEDVISDNDGDSLDFEVENTGGSFIRDQRANRSKGSSQYRSSPDSHSYENQDPYAGFQRDYKPPKPRSQLTAAWDSPDPIYADSFGEVPQKANLGDTERLLPTKPIDINLPITEILEIALSHLEPQKDATIETLAVYEQNLNLKKRMFGMQNSVVQQCLQDLVDASLAVSSQFAKMRKSEMAIKILARAQALLSTFSEACPSLVPGLMVLTNLAMADCYSRLGGAVARKAALQQLKAATQAAESHQPGMSASIQEAAWVPHVARAHLALAEVHLSSGRPEIAVVHSQSAVFYAQEDIVRASESGRNAPSARADSSYQASGLNDLRGSISSVGDHNPTSGNVTVPEEQVIVLAVSYLALARSLDAISRPGSLKWYAKALSTADQSCSDHVPLIRALHTVYMDAKAKALAAGEAVPPMSQLSSVPKALSLTYGVPKPDAKFSLPAIRKNSASPEGIFRANSEPHPDTKQNDKDSDPEGTHSLNQTAGRNRNSLDVSNSNPELGSSEAGRPRSANPRLMRNTYGKFGGSYPSSITDIKPSPRHSLTRNTTDQELSGPETFNPSSVYTAENNDTGQPRRSSRLSKNLYDSVQNARNTHRSDSSSAEERNEQSSRNTSRSHRVESLLPDTLKPRKPLTKTPDNIGSDDHSLSNDGRMRGQKRVRKIDKTPDASTVHSRASYQSVEDRERRVYVPSSESRTSRSEAGKQKPGASPKQKHLGTSLRESRRKGDSDESFEEEKSQKKAASKNNGFQR